MDLLNDAAAHFVDPLLVEADHDRSHAPVVGDKVPFQQIVAQGKIANIFRTLRVGVLEQRPHIEAAVVIFFLGGYRRGS